MKLKKIKLETLFNDLLDSFDLIIYLYRDGVSVTDLSIYLSILYIQ